MEAFIYLVTHPSNPEQLSTAITEAGNQPAPEPWKASWTEPVSLTADSWGS